MAFWKAGRKKSMRRVPNEVFGVRVFRSKVCENNFSRSGAPKIDDFGPFQESMVEISVKCEKTCFLRPRFFRKIEEMGGYFWGAP